MSRYLLPLISTVVAIVVAVGAVLVGMRFAAPSEVDVPTGTEIVPVLEPVSTGDEAPPAEADDGTLITSPAVAEREVRVPAASSTDLDPGLAEVIDTLTAAVDPAAALLALDLPFDSIGSALGGDPCAPRESAPGEGAPSDDCPEGLRSTVLPLVSVPEFSMIGQAFPPTYDQYLADGNPFGGTLWCDGLVAGEGQVTFGILASAPGTFTVEYWPTASPGESTTVTGIVTDAALADAYAAALPTAESLLDLPIVQMCVVLDGFEPDTAYTAVVRGIDFDLRSAAPHTLRFHSAGAPVHPGAQIRTVGENLVFVSGLHPADQTVSIRVTSVGTGATPDCAARATIAPLTQADTTVTAEQLAALRAFPDFDRKHVETFQVPEGSTVLVCVRWYAGGDATSWERQQPLFESSTILQAPDRLVPIVTLQSLTGAAEGQLDVVGVQVASAEGSACSSPLTISVTARLPLPICESTGGGVRSESDRLWDVGFDGDLVVSLTPRLTTGESAETRFLIPAGDYGCRGECVEPPSSWYVVHLDPVRQGTGLCGSFFGSDCTPPSREVVAGSAVLSVAWVQGESNGRADWNVAPTVDIAPEYVVPPAPVLNTDNVWTFSEPDYRRPDVTASLLLEVDRPVDYTITFGPETAIAQRCGSEGVLQVSGRVESSATVQMPGVCLGGTYQAQIELVDDAGNRSVWGVVDRSWWWGPGAIVEAPVIPARITYDLTAQHVGFSSIEQLDLRINWVDMGISDTRSGRCTRDGIVFSSGSADVELWSAQTVQLTIHVRSTVGWTESSCNRFSDLTVGNPVREVTVTVPIADLFRPEGAVITIPDAYNTRLVLRAGLL